jgi:hypothetical protein
MRETSILAFLASFILLIQTCQSSRFNSTGWGCTNQNYLLECPQSQMIVITQSQHKYTPSMCANFDLYDYNLPLYEHHTSLEECYATKKHNIEAESMCNGKSYCATRFYRSKHRNGFDGNCDFYSNLQNIDFTCIPEGNL